MNIQELIKQFEAKREASHSRMLALMELAGTEGRSLNEEESTEYEDLASEVKGVDAHLVRLRETEKLAVTKAQRVVAPAADADAEAAAARARSPHIVAVEKKLPPGVEFARYAACIGVAKVNLMQAYEIA